MAVVGRKCKAASSLEESAKRLRIGQPPPSPGEKHQLAHQSKTTTNLFTEAGPFQSEGDEEEEDKEYEQERDESSEEEQTADTPITPFSPTRKKFPSELKSIKCTFEGCTKTF